MTAAVLLGVLPTIAGAQYSQNPDADYIQVNVKGWLFCPVTDQSRVQGFLAYFDAEGTGSNVQLVWYEREGDDAWSTWAWEDKDLGAAVWYVRDILADNSAFSRDPVLGPAAAAVGEEAALAPKPMSNGLFLTTPCNRRFSNRPIRPRRSTCSRRSDGRRHPPSRKLRSAPPWTATASRSSRYSICCET